MSDDAAAATTAPAPARIQPSVRRSPRNASHTARAAAWSSGVSRSFTTIERAIAYAITSRPPAAAAPSPSSITVSRLSGDSQSAPAMNASDRTIRRIARIWIVSAMFASVALRLPMFSLTTSTRSVERSSLASSGRTCWSAAASTVPTSAIVSVTVFLSRLNSAR
jgi:hypothetical protein